MSCWFTYNGGRRVFHLLFSTIILVFQVTVWIGLRHGGSNLPEPTACTACDELTLNQFPHTCFATSRSNIYVRIRAPPIINFFFSSIYPANEIKTHCAD